MNYRAIRSFRILKGTIIIPPKLQDKRNVCMMLLSENQDFLSTHPYLPFRYVTLRHIYVPTIQKPARTYMTPEYKKELLARKLRAYRGDMKDFMSVKDKNFYLDFSLYLNMIKTRYRATKFLTGRPLMLLKTIFNNMAEVPSSEYEKVLFYSINLDEPMDERIRYRKIWPVFLMLQAFDKGTIKELPFDRLMLHVFDKNGLNNTVQLYSNATDTRINLGRIRALLMKLKVNDESFENDVVDDTAEEAADNVIDHISTNTDNLNTERNKMSIASSIARKIPGEVKLDDINTKESLPNYAESQRSKIKNAISSYISNATKKSEISLSIEPMNMNSKKKMALKSLAYHSMADEDAADEFEDEFDEMPVQKQAVKINEFVKNTLPKVKAKNTSTNVFIKNAKPDELNDFQNPGHIYEKRKSDFRETLIEDLLDTFKVLENKHSSLKINSIDVKTIYSPPSELEPTIRDRFSLKLVDKKGRIHLATIELPHLTDNGTFMVNGQEKIITNQIITYPIFFFKPYHGKFTSSYSAVTVHSKILSKSSYLMCYMAGYKFPLILWLAYKQGFENVLKQYGVEYSISEEKETEDFIVLPNKLVLNIKNSTEQGRQLIEGIKYSAAFMSKTDKDINQPKYWKDALEDFIGNRNCIYLMDQIWLNIVTPIEVKLLEAKNDPTNINDIVHYISTQVVNGRVDDRNSLNKQRVRTSEIFVALVQKQVHAAYNEYEAKVQSGDEEARLYIDPTKTFSDVINSQNVQTLENINPVEELSTMTRITPVGIGGVTDRMAFPPKAMGIHESYYGNVDPLETPDGAGVGIQQQLTIGANITNIRGMFNVKDKNDINPSEILSAGTSMIPFVESNDGCRVLMSASQMKQAIPLKNNEIPAIQTGFESVFTNFLSDNFIKKSPVDGTVVKVEDLLITIKDKASGKLFYIETKPRLLRSGQGKNGLSVFTSIVKEGQKVSKGDIISEGSNVKEGTIANGLNVLCAFMPWKGYNFEDGMVISESLAKRFVSVHLQEENVYLSDDEDVVFIASVGEEYKKGNIVFSYTNAVYDVESYKHLRTDGGKIVNIEVFSNIEEDRIPEKLLPAYNETVKMMNATTGKYTLGTFREKGEKFEGILIRFTIEQTLGLHIGDKLNNRSFNKGLVSCCDTRTYIFTDRGWKLFKDLTDDDKVAYIEDKKTMKAGFVKPEKIIVSDYSGEMCGHSFKYGIDYLMTPNHKMLYKNEITGETSISDASEIQDLDHISFYTSCNFNLKNDKETTVVFEHQVNGYKKEVLTFDKKDFYSFFGWWITEGCAYNNKNNRNKVIITQSKMEHQQEIHDLLTRMNFGYCKSKNDHNFIISDKALYEYFSQFGKSYEKYIPEWMFHTSKENLIALHSAMIKGDGSFRDDDHYGFYSTSRQLMDDFARLCYLIGDRPGNIREEKQKRVRVKYTLNVAKNSMNEFLHVPKGRNYTVDYNDKIYCVTVPNNLIFVKRDGFAFWTGNCIEKDENMPYVPELGRHVEMVYNPLSVINRMNPGQLLEMNTSLISNRLAELMETNSRENFTKIFAGIMDVLDATENKQYSKNLLSSIVKMTDGEYEKLRADTKNRKFIPLVFPPFKSPDRKDILRALKMLGLKARYKVRLKQFDDWETDPVAIGFIYVMKLEHIAEKKLHARGIGPYVARTMAATQGKRRSGGQSASEYDMISLLAWDCPTIIDELLGPMAGDHITKNEMIAEITQAGETHYKAPKSNPVKDLFSNMMIAVHLKAE